MHEVRYFSNTLRSRKIKKWAKTSIIIPVVAVVGTVVTVVTVLLVCVVAVVSDSVVNVVGLLVLSTTHTRSHMQVNARVPSNTISS